MSEIRTKKWNMRPETRIIVSEAYRLCKEMNETYGQKVNVRQIYYHLFSKALIELNERNYQRVCRFLTKARKRGYIPFEWIEDRSRHPLWEMLYQNIQHFLNLMMNEYKRNTWTNQENFVIILLEKEALAPIIWDIANDYNVFVFPTKGFSSWSMFVQDIRSLVEYFGKDKRLIVLVLSDLDPSGQHIKEDYVNKFKFMADELDFTTPSIIEKIAVTLEQVEMYNLPLIEKKYKKRTVKIVELDALEPKILRNIVKDSIEKYLDIDQLHKDLDTERKELEYFQFLIKNEFSNRIGENG
jgi:hypothetical protein